MQARAAIAFLVASSAIFSAVAADPGCRQNCFIQDKLHGKDLGVVEAVDDRELFNVEQTMDHDNAYYRVHDNRSFQRWSIAPSGEPDYYILVWGSFRLGSADPSDGRLHLRPNSGPVLDTQKWRFTLVEPGYYAVADKASSNFLGLAAPADAGDKYVYHRASTQTRWKVIGGPGPTQPCPPGYHPRKQGRKDVPGCEPDNFVADVAKLTSANQKQELAAWHGYDKAVTEYEGARGGRDRWKSESDAWNNKAANANCAAIQCPIQAYLSAAKSADAQANAYQNRMDAAKKLCNQHKTEIEAARALETAAHERFVSLRGPQCAMQ